MRRTLYFILAALGAIALTGCMANSVKTAGEQVVIVQSIPPQYHCTYKGEVAGSQGNWLTGGWTSNQNLAIGARNDLRNEAGKLVGDVDFENVKQKVSYITPVPGGVGPMTIAMLMNNVIKATEEQTRK